MRGYFSVTQLRIKSEIPGPTFTAHDEDRETREIRTASTVCSVYEREDSDDIVVVTEVGDIPAHAFDDTIDMGPVGNFLHAFKGGDKFYPHRALVLPRHRLYDLTTGRLSEYDIKEAGERALEGRGNPKP